MPVTLLGSRFSFPRTGGERHTYEIARYLEKQGVDLHVIEFRDIPTAVLRNPLLCNLWYIFQLAPVGRGSRLLVEADIHLRAFIFNWYARAGKRFKIVLVIHHLEHDLRPSRILRWVDHMTTKIFLRAADHVITISQSSKEQLEAMGVDEHKISIVAPGVDLPPLDLGNRRKRVRRRLNLLFVGRCTVIKGLEYLLGALSLIKDDHMSLNIVGDVEDDKEYVLKLQNQIDAYGIGHQVCFRGRVPEDELWQAYSQADIFVLPSLWEGYGIVLVEAMFFGLPIVATHTGSIPELVREGENGLLVPPGDSLALSEAISRLLRDPALRIKLGVNGKATLKDARTWGDCAAEAYQILHREFKL